MKSLLRRWIRLAVAGAAAGAVVLMAPNPAQAVRGGTLSEWSAYPYMVRLDGCSGTLITRTAVLTSQYCALRSPGPRMATFSNGVTVAATVYSTMPGYATDAVSYDLAVLSVPASATAGVPVMPQVGSPWRTENYQPGVQSTLVGFGASAHNASDFGTLRAIDTPIRSDDAMDEIFFRVTPWPWPWADDVWIPRLLIGAGGTARSMCDGDEGGPMMVAQGDGRLVQVGVYSFGLNCQDAAAFTELSGANLAWLASMVPSVQFGWGPCT
ncbi:trypsin-like serine protease, partial [Acrocarpospora phusangensis]|uniref:trypsin-like serine protease n=1 Tax=Acrocarpospora phusangensis TaxID=1070424 RepID=UPI00194F5C05